MMFEKEYVGKEYVDDSLGQVLTVPNEKIQMNNLGEE